MGAGHQNSACSGQSHDSSPAPSTSTLSGCSSSDTPASVTPVSLLVLLHEGFRRVLAELKGLAAEASGACDARNMGVVVGELRRRVESFRNLYRYHCVAEAEVIFLVLDARVKNVTCTYYLQHHSTDSMFETIVSCLDSVANSEESSSQLLQEVLFHIGILRDSICQHMVKEEKQVFALLMSHFSAEEQATIVWQFVSSLPVMVFEDLFPWLACFLSPNERLNLKDCIRIILRQDNSTLQEALIFWIDKAPQQCQGCYDKFDKSSESPHEQSNLRETSNFTLLNNSFCGNEDCQKNVENVLLEGLALLHAAIRSYFKEIMDELYQTRSKTSSSLSSVISEINFLTEVLIIHSETLERVLYPPLEGTPLLQHSVLFRNEVGRLKKFVNDAVQMKLTDATFLEMLCSKVESLLLVTCEHLSFQETEVFPLISKNCSHETQQKLLLRSLRELPLGLLKCVVIWFSSRLPKDNLKSLLRGIELSCLLDKPFGSLLHEWIRTGIAGKTSTDNLQELLKRRVSYWSKPIRDDKDPCENSDHSSQCLFDSSTSFNFRTVRRCSGVNSDKFSLAVSEMPHSFHGSLNEAFPINFREPRPMDHIYYFHKAIKKDLESLVVDSAKLSTNLEFLTEFSQHFRFVRSLYELHSETEDKIAFPALEENPNSRNLTQSYSIDHEMEAESFDRVSAILSEMSELYQTVPLEDVDPGDTTLVKYHQLSLQLEDSCYSLKKILEDHILREETELWPLFREYFSLEEQEKILGYMLGRTRVESLQEMIVWLMAYLTLEEQHAIMTFWLKATKWTKFNEWLGEWWEGMNKFHTGEGEESTVFPSSAMGSKDSASKHQSTNVSHDWRENFSDDFKLLHNDAKEAHMVKEVEVLDVENQKHKSSEYTRVSTEKEKGRKDDYTKLEQRQLKQVAQEVDKQTKHLVTSQIELEDSTRRVSLNSSLDLQEKLQAAQHSSHLVAAQPQSDPDVEITRESRKLQGQYPSYQDKGHSVFGCKHYKQNCKLVAACCNRLFTCRRCHDEEISDHVMERKSTTEMMCMKCLEVQPIRQTCSTPSCNEYSMARYYCRICRLFDNERDIYHCPYCNLCRVGKGLGIDYFHCMKCNACMGKSMNAHTCIEKCIEDKCPICQEDMFTSTDPIKSLNCGHVMHSTCFQDYTCMRYTCPICSKSLGNMQVYFEMLDALLAEEKMPEEYRGQTQAILCNDCEKKGTAPFHFMYHKCPYCGSYNTRRL